MTRGHKGWPLPKKITPSPHMQRREVLQRWADTIEGREELRAFLTHFREARDIHKHNARECQAAVEAIESVLGEIEA